MKPPGIGIRVRSAIRRMPCLDMWFSSNPEVNAHASRI